jgi:hypothetical protein
VLAVSDPSWLREGQYANKFASLLQQLLSAIKPKDTIENIFVRDIADLTWEIMRYRRLKARIIRRAEKDALEAIVKPLRPQLQFYDLIRQWERGDPEAVKEVSVCLKEIRKDFSDVNALALSRCLRDVERIEALTSSAEGRRNLIIKEVERRRDIIARRAQEAITFLEPKK